MISPSGINLHICLIQLTKIQHFIWINTISFNWLIVTHFVLMKPIWLFHIFLFNCMQLKFERWNRLRMEKWKWCIVWNKHEQSFANTQFYVACQWKKKLTTSFQWGREKIKKNPFLFICLPLPLLRLKASNLVFLFDIHSSFEFHRFAIK